jgi:hypothetical protein
VHVVGNNIELVELKSWDALTGCGTPGRLSKLYCHILFSLQSFFGHDPYNAGWCIDVLVIDETDDAACYTAFPVFDCLMSWGAWLKSAKDNLFCVFFVFFHYHSRSGIAFCDWYVL